MKLTTTRDALAAALSPLVRIAPSKTTLPILSHVLLQPMWPSGLNLTATNLEVAMTRRIAAEVQEDGACTVPVATLAEYVDTLQHGLPITLELDETTHRLAVTCGRSSANIATFDANDFPPMAGEDAEVIMTMPAALLRSVIADVEYATAGDDSRPVLAGVGILGRGETYDFAAADGFRLAIRAIERPSGAPADGARIVPGHALRHVAKVLPTDDEIVSLSAAANVMKFDVGQTTLVTRLVEGQFPDYQRVIPSETPLRVIVNRLDLLQAVKMARVFGKSNSEIVRVNVDTETAQATISARGSEIGDGASTVELADVFGDPLQVAYNGRYLLDALEHLRGDQVELACSGPTTPGLIRPVGDEHDRVLCVVMPMHIAQEVRVAA